MTGKLITKEEIEEKLQLKGIQSKAYWWKWWQSIPFLFGVFLFLVNLIVYLGEYHTGQFLYFLIISVALLTMFVLNMKLADKSWIHYSSALIYPLSVSAVILGIGLYYKPIHSFEMALSYLYLFFLTIPFFTDNLLSGFLAFFASFLSYGGILFYIYPQAKEELLQIFGESQYFIPLRIITLATVSLGLLLVFWGYKRHREDINKERSSLMEQRETVLESLKFMRERLYATGIAASSLEEEVRYSITNAIDVLENVDDYGEEALNYAKKVLSEAIQNLEKVSSVIHPKSHKKIKQYEFPEMINDFIQSIAERYMGIEFILRNHIPYEDDTPILIYPETILSAIRTLSETAIEAGADVVEVSLFIERRKIVVDVKDNGKPIKNVKELFSPKETTIRGKVKAGNLFMAREACKLVNMRLYYMHSKIFRILIPITSELVLEKL